ncbi:hypothetical protein BGW38_000729 [Lunasporangiospora selenospora]|uniref:Uncharacterized protein n=1 Tax=Lunasporangiospora selenospora TaxID=979761 RepID=A0A9P6KI32_9FUNG|nr:hypothetical protein BGW38_000729 [Lunasporangiospora selenospora]
MKDEVSTAGLPRPKAQPNPKQEQQPLRRYPLRTPTPRPHQQHQQTDSLDQPPRSTRSVTFAEPDQPRSMPCSPSPSPPTSSSRAWSEAAPVGFMEASVHSSPPPPYIESMTMAGLGTTLATPMSLELRSAPIGSQRAEAPHLVRRQSLSDLAKSPLTDLAPSSTCSPSSSSQSEFREPPSPPGNVAQRQQEQQQQLQNQKLRGHRRNQSAPTLSASAKAKAEAALSSPMTSSLTASGAKKSGNRFSRLWKSLAHRYSHPAHTVVSAVHCSTIDKMSPGEHDPIGVTTVQSNGRRSELQPLVT